MVLLGAGQAANETRLIRTELSALGIVLILISPLALSVGSSTIRYSVMVLGMACLLPSALLSLKRFQSNLGLILLVLWAEVLSLLNLDEPLEVSILFLRYSCYLAAFSGAGCVTEEIQSRTQASSQTRNLLGDLLKWLVPALCLLGTIVWFLLGRSMMNKGGRFALEGLNTVGMGLNFGTLSLMLGTLGFLGKGKERYLCYIASVSCLLCMIQTGSRGPVLAWLLSVAAFAIVYLVFNSTGFNFALVKRWITFALAACIVIAAIAILVPEQFEFVKSRIEVAGDSRRDLSSRIRIADWNYYWSRSAEWLPLGLPGYSQIDGYPHNIALDTGIRFGIVGIIGVLVAVGLGAFRFIQLMRSSSNAYLAALLLAGIFMFFVSLVSCHVFMLRATWLLMGVGLSPWPRGASRSPRAIPARSRAVYSSPR